MSIGLLVVALVAAEAGAPTAPGKLSPAVSKEMTESIVAINKALGLESWTARGAKPCVDRGGQGITAKDVSAEDTRKCAASVIDKAFPELGKSYVLAIPMAAVGPVTVLPPPGQESPLGLDGVAPATGDELRQVAVAFTVGREQHELHAVGERQLAAEDQWQRHVLGREMSAHRARQRAFVGQRKGCIALALGALDQLLGVRCAAQEREVGQAVKLGIGRQQIGRCHTG